MKIPKIIFLLLLLLTVSLGCKQNRKSTPKTTMREAKERLEVANRAMVDKDRERIEAYISRHGILGIEENKAGLFYLVWGDSTGPQVKTRSVVVLDYKISLLDGTICYDSANEKPKEFLVGQGGVESGLEMAVLLMKEGQKGKFILPPHLGHGLLGDYDKIPPLAILVFDVELLFVLEN